MPKAIGVAGGALFHFAHLTVWADDRRSTGLAGMRPRLAAVHKKRCAVSHILAMADPLLSNPREQCRERFVRERHLGRANDHPAHCPCREELRSPHLMKFTIYEDPRTHAFAFLALPNRFVEGDALPVGDVDRWFRTREEAIAALSDLLNREEPDTPVDSDSPDRS